MKHCTRIRSARPSRQTFFRHGSNRLRLRVLAALLSALVAAIASFAPSAQAAPHQPNFGSNVMIFDPSMPTSQIQAAVDAIAARQVTNQFGSERIALLFKPGVYGSPATPLIIQVGYYTEVAGLGASPNDVIINGHVDVYNQCENGFCIALNNFWRALSNLTINVMGAQGCYSSGNFWAVSQAAPMRRVHITGGNLTLMDYCSGPSFASGGFIADSNLSFTINGSQQQFLVRNSNVAGWSNGVWNQVFSGVVGAPAECFPSSQACGGPYTTLAASPVTREKPFLTIDAAGSYSIFVPALRRNASGTSWANGQADGSFIPLSRFFVARPSDDIHSINEALASGRHLLLTPGVYRLNQTIKVKRANTVVLGLGMPTLVPQKGIVAMSVADVPGVKLAGFMVDAGPINSPMLMEIGKPNAHKSDPNNPTSIQDVFFRIGGAALGKATTSLVINSDNVLLDDIWAWRADHGNGVGWTQNIADTGVIVNGDHVTAYGLFVEHYQKYETMWNGNDGKVIFYQNEMPYDPPSQQAWQAAPNVFGWAALKVANTVTSFKGYGMGSYSFFNQGIDIYAANAFEVPTTLASGSLHNMLTIFLDPNNGKGGILNVVNDVGGSSTIANPDVPVTVVNYP